MRVQNLRRGGVETVFSHSMTDDRELGYALGAMPAQPFFTASSRD